MTEERRATRRRGTRSFVLGGILGASAVVAGARRRRRRRRRPVGLAAFESAPCFRESSEAVAGDPS